MFKICFVLAGLTLCINALQAQQSAAGTFLQSIESNNQALAAYRSYVEKQSLQFKSENKLPDPSASAYFLPFGEHNTGNYSEYQVSQDFDFPTVYASRGKWINSQHQRLELEYAKLRQEVLLKAKELGIELAYLQKLQEVIKLRTGQSEKVFLQIKTLFDQGQSGILDLNKARIIWLDQQFALEELEFRIDSVKRELQALNGGAALDIPPGSLEGTVEIPATDSLWNERMLLDPQIALLEQEKLVAQQRLKLERNQLLPGLTAGYNYQGVAGSNYSGFYGGLSIPLWSGRNKVQMAKATINFQEKHQADAITNLKSEFTSRAERYQLLLSRFRDYQNTLAGMNSEVLLHKTYELGELSFMDFYREVTFYRQAENRMLELEKELQQLKAELLKHQL